MIDSVSRQIADLKNLSYKELKMLWQTMYGTRTPAYNRVYLIKRLAYRIQELTYGGLSDSTKKRLRQILVDNGYDENGCKAGNSQGKTQRVDSSSPVLGTRLQREWNGRLYEVTVVTGGFEYDGKRYRSLTAVARAITGTHWNGRKFFGQKSTRSNA